MTEEEAKRRGIPVIPKLPDDIYDPNRYDPNRTVAVCGQCGMELKGVMGYVCPQPRCPTGMGGAWCIAGEGAF